jgi:ribokinase
MTIAVFGSINMDLVVRTPRFPKPGETLSGHTFYTAPGGKGANQAVAAARLGASTSMVGRVGQDVFSKALLESLQTNRVNTDGIWRDPDHPSGTALIMVDDSAENSIIIVPGANGAICSDDLERLEGVLKTASHLLLQLEIPLEMVVAAAKLARQHGVTVILDPAPACSLPEELYHTVDWITPNESEASVLTQQIVQTPQEAAEAAKVLHERGVPQTVIKMGSRGAFWSDGEEGRFLPAYLVQAVDTVAAGDAFNGALATALSEGKPVMEALNWAMAAGALSTTRYGAQPSMPERRELLAFMEERKG